ncbi:hypothetical protein ANN_04428 [Periplaneta americana]|uniref:Uncharacterized protein n=1 Tax=Periplaneta americana TaxID=6978 RepID=A0ABQ8TAG4_PERAM|nr:hypothetical protein ANN_04428 [Periplaneta americana]
MGCTANISMRDLVSTVKLSPAAYKIGNRRDKRRLQQAATSTSENFKTSRKKVPNIIFAFVITTLHSSYLCAPRDDDDDDDEDTGAFEIYSHMKNIFKKFKNISKKAIKMCRKSLNSTPAGKIEAEVQESRNGAAIQESRNEAEIQENENAEQALRLLIPRFLNLLITVCEEPGKLDAALISLAVRKGSSRTVSNKRASSSNEEIRGRPGIGRLLTSPEFCNNEPPRGCTSRNTDQTASRSSPISSLN